MPNCFSTIAAIGLHLGSWHAEPDYNNFNPGLFARSECEILRGQPQIGVFYNSEEEVSVYAGIEFEYDRDAMGTPFLIIGVATGYERAPIAPLVNIGFRFGPISDDFPIAIALGFSPAVGNPCKGVATGCREPSNLIHLAVEWRF